MRFVQLISHYLPATRFGGPQRVAHGLGRALVELGHQVTVCCTNMANERDDLNVPIDEAVDVDGVRVFYEPTKLSRYWGFSPTMHHRSKQLIQDADVVLVHFHYQYANFVGARLARRLHKPYFVFAHGSFQRASMQRRGSTKKNVYLATLERRNLRQANGIIFNAKEEQENSRFGDQGFIIRNGIAPSDLQLPPRGTFRSEFPQLNKKTMLLFLGRIDFYGKGLDLLLDAIRDLDETSRNGMHLVLAGPSERDGLRQTEERVRANGISDNVTFTGLIEGDRKLAALADADAFLLPSRSEGLSIALLEALYCGIPVLITNRVGLHSTVTELGAGVVANADAAGISDGLTTILSHEARETMKGKATPRMQMDFSWSSVVPYLLEICRAENCGC